MIDDIKNELNAMAEADYRDFSKKLIPEASLPLLGVRLPALRAAAAEIVKRGRGDEFLRECDFSSMEMCFLYAYVLGKTRADINALIKYFDNAAYHVDNWSTCDILCQSFKQCRRYPEQVWDRLTDYLASGRTYYMRIAVVTMMSHYLNDEYIDRVFAALRSAHNDDYYYKMPGAPPRLWQNTAIKPTVFLKTADLTIGLITNRFKKCWNHAEYRMRIKRYCAP